MESQSNCQKYRMTISLSVLDHLGIGLYSNVPAVLSEVVANAWDADAENVYIKIDSERGEIVISDDGIGMTESDINEKYLKVGYKKRDSEPNHGITPIFQRPPMGRKGIGKLSVFSIADVIEIQTVKGDESNAFRMDSNKIKSLIESQSGEAYHPEALSSEDVKIRKGTRITLSCLRKKTHTVTSNLRRRLARRFSIIGCNDFKVTIDGQQISATDRDYYKFIQFLWYFGEESEHFKELCANVERPSTVTGSTVDEAKDLRISGWIGTVKKQEQIEEDTNGIVIFGNGKLVHENLLKDMKEGGVWTKYIIGEIDADFMDDNDEEDIITSARQSLKEDDERFIALKKFLQDGVIREIATNWQKWRPKKASEKVLRERKNIRRWYDRLGADQKDNAAQLLGKIENFEDSDEADKRDLFKGIMLVFERLVVTDQISLLKDLETERDFELISKIFGNLADLARVHYYDIAKVRLEIIKKFKEIIDENKKERVIQEHIFKALWLLDPSWEPASTSARMEETVTNEFKKVSGRLTDAEKLARIDIRYQTVSGTHVIIELKRHSEPIQIYALLAQLKKYKSALQKCLDQFDNRYSKMPVVTICITGKRPRDDEEVEKLLIAADARWTTYNDLIDNALNSYKDYLKAESRISELAKIIDSIDKDFDT